MLFRAQDQAKKDRQRVTYRLAFPHELTEDQVVAWITSVSGTLRRKHHVLSGAPTIALEMWSTSDGFTWRIRMPWQYADYIKNQLMGHVPGISLLPEEDFPRPTWQRVVELGLSHSSRPLHIASTPQMSTTLLRAVQSLMPDEMVVMQWVVTPALPQHKPIYREAHTDLVSMRHLTHGSIASKDEVSERRDKLTEPNMLAVLRIGVIGSTEIRTEHLLDNLRKALASIHGPATKFTATFASRKAVQDKLAQAAGLAHFPAKLSASELAALMAWPVGNPSVPGLPTPLARQLPAPANVPKDAKVGRVLGRSNFSGDERPIVQAHKDALRHLHVVGPTGVGKTTMLANLIKQDIEAGYGVVLIDAKGGESSLFAAALDYIPARRIEDVIVLDVQDTAHPVGFNILNQGDPKMVIDELTELFEMMYDSKSVWTKEVLYHGLRTIAADPRLTFIDLGTLLVPMTSQEVAWRDGLIRSLTDKELRQFWQRFDNQPRSAQDRITQPVMDRIWQLNARPEIKHIIGQSSSSFQMTDIVAEHKILLINLGGLAAETASLAGTLLTQALWRAAKGTPGNNVTFLYMDEFQKFIRLPIDPESMLAEARGFGLGMTLAHQHLNQLPTELRGAILANARSKVVFQTSNDDARQMAREFGTAVTERDFMQLGKFEAIARVATGDGVSAPLTMVTSEPAKPYGKSKAVRYVSRQKYGRPVGDVMREIDSRRQPEPQPARKRPRISGSGPLDMP